MVRLRIGDIKREVRECIAGSHPGESYDHEMIDDPSFKKKSVYVPDDIKELIKLWLVDMGLAGRRQ